MLYNWHKPYWAWNRFVSSSSMTCLNEKLGRAGRWVALAPRLYRKPSKTYLTKVGRAKTALEQCRAEYWVYGISVTSQLRSNITAGQLVGLLQREEQRCHLHHHHCWAGGWSKNNFVIIISYVISEMLDLVRKRKIQLNH